MNVPREMQAPALAAGGVFLAAVAFLFASEPGTRLVVAVEDVVLLLASAVASVALYRAGGRVTGGARVAWRLGALGTSLYALGMAEWTRRQVLLGEPVPSPSLADVGFLGYMIVAGLGFLFLRTRSPAGRLRVLLDGLTVGLGILIVSLVLIVLPVVAPSPGGAAFSLSTVIFVAYPIGDAVMLMIAVLVAMDAPARDQPPLYLLAAGIASIAIADSSYTYRAIHGTYATGIPTDALWIAGMLLLALAGRWAELRPLDPAPARATRASALLPTLAMGVVLVALLALTLTRSAEPRVHAPIVEGGVLLVLALLVARHAVATLDHHHLVDRLEATVQSVQREVAQRTAALQRSNNDLRHFASAASHDLQEPLRTVRSYTQLVERRYADKLDAEGREFLHYASDAAKRMSALIDGLLAYARIDLAQRELKPIPSETALTEAKANLAVAILETGAIVEVEDSLPTVKADPSQLTLLFQNVLGNAIKYRGKETPRIRVSVTPEIGAWRFSVRDNGIGIAPEFHERVFGIFQRLHTQQDRPGSGIGLAVCRRIVERHGGRIWVESAPGEGAAFHFTLPPGDAVA